MRLIVVLDRHTAGVEEDQHYNKPIEPLRLDGVPDPEPEAFLGAPETLAATLVLHFRF